MGAFALDLGFNALAGQLELVLMLLVRLLEAWT
jgi:hypothetical protein